MKALFQTLATGCLAITLLASTNALARTWTSADGKSTFEGNLVAYDAGTGEVTVDRGENKMTFDQTLLSDKDIEFLKSEKATPVATPSKPAPAKPSGNPVIADKVAGGTGDIEIIPAPQAGGRKPWLIQNFGPVGIGIMLEKDLSMKINNVEEGSPAEKAGKLEKGQIIESINGVKLTDTNRDPRLVLAELITHAEAGDGRINLMIAGQDAVTVNIPVMGTYSSTWPLNCEKSDRIVRNLADLLAKQGKDEWGSALFLLSTGEEKDLDVVRGWMKDIKSVGGINWEIGMRGLGVCEYYLRTGDSSVLPAIQNGADQLRDSIYNGGWSGRAAAYSYQSGGQLNAAGIHCLTFILLAKTCGVDVDEATLQSSLRHFYRFSGRGSVPYGNYTSKAGYRDCNGKTGGLALAMAAASRLTPDGDSSVYAEAAQINAMKSYYGTNIYQVGHTGGGIGEIWKSASMGLMTEKRPKQYRDYMDAKRWTLELSRRHNGGIGIGGGSDGNYDQAVGEGKAMGWGTFYALSYTLPRKHLHLFGAPKSEWAKSYTLPERPWGNAADDTFSSPYPVPGGPWSKSDILQETLDEHIGEPVSAQLSGSDVSDQTIATYLHHPEFTHRFEAKDALVRLKKHDKILELLVSEEARLQHIGVMALHDLFGTWDKKNKDPEKVTPAMMDQVEKIIRDPDGSLYVKPWAIGLLQHVDLERLRTFRDLLATFVEHEEHWMQGSSMSMSVPLLKDPESYKILFPPIARAISKATVYSIVTRASIITEKLGEASPEIQAYGLDLMKTVYLAQPDELVSDRGIYVIPGGGAIKRQSIGRVVGFSEMGMDFLDSQPKATSAWKASGRDEDMYVYDGTFKPNKDFHGKWCSVSHEDLGSTADAVVYLKDQLEKGKVPPLQPDKITYGLTVSDDGQVKALGYTQRKYAFPMRYSGNMAFTTFIDKAYHYEVVNIGDREFLIMEWDFEPERDEDYKPIYKTYVKVGDSD
jgi:hypothetical protein